MQEHLSCICVIYIKMERDKLKEKLSWNEIRNLILNIKPSKKEHYGNNCRKCIWSDTESGKILCSRYKCIKEENQK